MAGEFWSSIARSLGRIALGFVLACTLGVLLAALAYACDSVRRLLAPVVGAVKAAPVASFIILVLVWVSSRDLSLVISFLMGFPIMYTNVLEALRATDAGMLEMADVFRLSVADRIRSIYLSQALPSFEAACSLALGFCWKAGIAGAAACWGGCAAGGSPCGGGLYAGAEAGWPYAGAAPCGGCW